MKANSVNWFEIPTEDFERAVTFYQAVLGVALKREKFNGVPHAIFPTDEKTRGVTGALVFDPRLKPGAGGARLYLDVTGRIDECLTRVGTAGGELLMGKTDIAPHGFCAIVKDTEGNQIALHAM